MLKLIIEDDEGRKTVVPFVRDEITIGRQEGNTIRLTERNVSRRHARLLRQSGAVKIEDLGSSNGIKVNGDRINGLVQVSDGDLIQIGDYDLAIQREEEARTAGGNTPMQLPAMRASQVGATQRLPNERETAPTMPALPAVDPGGRSSDATPPPGSLEAISGAEDDQTIPRQQSTSVIRVDQISSNRREVVELDSTQAPKLVVINTEFAGREFLISKTETRIGRVDDNDIFLDHRSLSRTHCKLVREDNGEWRVIDMQSANGLMVNGEPYAQVTLRSGDVIELGHVKMKFVGPGESFEAPTTTTVVETGEFEQLTPSKAPMIAIIATVAVLVLGGGGYVLLKPKTTQPTPPVKVAVEVPKPAPVIEPTETPEPDAVVVKTTEPAPGDDASKKAIADAQKALDNLDVTGAEAALKACKVNGAPCPQVAEMLAMVETEKGYAGTLKAAQAAIEKGDAQTARARLDESKNTAVFKARQADLESRNTKLLEKKLAEKPVAVVQAPVVAKPAIPVAPTGAAQTDKYIEEARTLINEKNFMPAIERLRSCLKLDDKNLVCLRLIASTHAKISSRDNSADDLRRAKEYYQKYVQVAPPDDKYVAPIKDILQSASP